MSSVLFFKNFTYYDENHPTPTIAGKDFQALLELCFAHADAFSRMAGGEEWRSGGCSAPLAFGRVPFLWYFELV